jgi:hypothetical protein
VKFRILVHFYLLFNLFGFVDMIFSEVNFGSFHHQNGEEDLLFLDLNMEFILMVKDLDQGDPSLTFRMDFFLRTGLRAAFPSSCHLQPFATRAAWHG